jgi:S-formylglutathione hydrolase FrmB
VRLKFRSAAIDRVERVVVLVPEGGGKRPLLIFLHGKGGNQNAHLQDEMFDAIEALGDRAPVIAFPAGGGSYWHDRRGGAWERMVRRELPRQVARRVVVDRSRLAVGGISMGGFGALSLARSGDYCAAGAHSPAIWRTGGETAPGAFDDAEDFARHDVIAHPPHGIPLWVDIGDEDPFLPGVRAFGRAAGVRVRVRDGGHSGDYWRPHYEEYLRFYARALEDCVAS